MASSFGTLNGCFFGTNPIRQCGIQITTVGVPHCHSQHTFIFYYTKLCQLRRAAMIHQCITTPCAHQGLLYAFLYTHIYSNGRIQFLLGHPNITFVLFYYCIHIFLGFLSLSRCIAKQKHILGNNAMYSRIYHNSLTGQHGLVYLLDLSHGCSQIPSIIKVRTLPWTSQLTLVTLY